MGKWSQEDLEKFQDDTFKVAQMHIERDRQLEHVAFLFSYADNFDPDLRKSLRNTDGEKISEEEFSELGDGDVLVVPCDPGDPFLFFDMLVLISEEDAGVQRAVQVLKQILSTIEDAEERYKVLCSTCDRIMKETGFDKMEVVSMFLRKLCKKTGAVAIAHISEIYIRSYARLGSETPEEGLKRIQGNYPRPRDDPESQEAVSSILQTQTGYRHITRTYKNNKETNTVDWGEVHVKNTPALIGVLSNLLGKEPQPKA